MNRTLLFIAVLAAALLAFATPVAYASGSASTAQTSSKSDRHEALERFKAALKQLDLTAVQKEKIKSVITETRSKLQALKGQGRAKGQIRPIIQQAREQIMAVLTKPQKARLREILKSDKSHETA